MGKRPSKHRRLSNVDEVRMIKVIEVRSLVGKGTEGDPGRTVTEYFSLDGKRLARAEPFNKEPEIHEWSYEDDD